MRRWMGLLLAACVGMGCMGGGAGRAQAEEPRDSLAMAALATRYIEGSPDQLAGHAQAVDRVYEAGALRVHVIDAVCDGTMVIAAWSVENTGGEQLYVVYDMLVEGVETGGHRARSGTFLLPGQTRYDGCATAIPQAVMDALGDAGPTVTLAVAGLWVMGETVSREEDGLLDLYMEDPAGYNAAVDRLRGEGKIVVEGGEWIALGGEGGSVSLGPDEKRPYMAQMLEQTGLFETMHRVEAVFAPARTGAVRSVLPDTPVERPFAGGTLRVVRADVSLCSAFLTIDFVYEDRADAALFTRAHAQPYAPVAVFDQDGRDRFYASGSHGFAREGEPEQRGDGTWVWTYEARYNLLAPMPEAFVIVPDTEAQPVEGLGQDGAAVDFSEAVWVVW